MKYKDILEYSLDELRALDYFLDEIKPFDSVIKFFRQRQTKHPFLSGKLRLVYYHYLAGLVVECHRFIFEIIIPVR